MKAGAWRKRVVSKVCLPHTENKIWFLTSDVSSVLTPLRAAVGLQR